MEDHLLGVFQCPSSKGVDQAEQVHNLLECYGCKEQMIVICCDATASNTGGENVAVQILTDILKVKMLWIMCRRDTYMKYIYRTIWLLLLVRKVKVQEEVFMSS